jgi:Spy/CpxP family protein refolding chaperone
MKRILRPFAFSVGAAVLGTALVAGVDSSRNVVSAQGQGQGQDSGRHGRFGGAGRGAGGGRVLGGLMLERLNLTDAQKGQVKAILDAHQTDLQAVGERLGTARRAMEMAIAADTVDENSIRARAADVAAVEADMAVMRARLRSEVVRILTPEQQNALKDFQSRAREHRRARDAR